MAKDLSWISPVVGAAGSILGLMTQKQQDKRQLDQQQKLQDMQIKGQEQLGQYNMDLQKQMWDSTNYEAQKQHIINAGLNPALLYGMSGGGGVTTGGVSENVSGAQAPAGSGQEIQQGMGIGMQMAAQMKLLNSQVEVNESIANKNNTDATKTGGVDTEIGKKTLEQMKAQITNTKAQTALTNIQTDIASIQKQFTEQKEGYTTELLQANLDKINQEWVAVKNQNDITQAAKDELIQTIKQNLTNTVLQGEATKAGIRLDQAKTEQASQDILQGWKDLDIKDKEQKINQLFIEKNINLLTTDRILKAVDGITKIATIGK